MLSDVCNIWVNKLVYMICKISNFIILPKTKHKIYNIEMIQIFVKNVYTLSP